MSRNLIVSLIIIKIIDFWPGHAKYREQDKTIDQTWNQPRAQFILVSRFSKLACKHLLLIVATDEATVERVCEHEHIQYKITIAEYYWGVGGLMQQDYGQY